MTGTMVHCYFTQELEEVANRLLPPDIVEEIGGTTTTTASAAGGTCCSSHSIIEGLAMHLISILGLPDMRAAEQQHQPPQANTPIGRPNNGGEKDGIGCGVLRSNNNGASRMPDIVLRSAEVTAFAYQQPLPVRQYNDEAVGAAAGEFRPMRRQNGSGTGVFFPRAGVWHTRTSKSSADNNYCAKQQPRMVWKEAPMTMKQQGRN